MGRAGYGFEALDPSARRQLGGRKRGALASSGDVLQLNKQGGFALCRGGKDTTCRKPVSDTRTILSIAKNLPAKARTYSRNSVCRRYNESPEIQRYGRG